MNISKTIISILGVTLIPLSLSACGPSKATQCQLVLETINEKQNQRVLGTQDKAAYLQNAQLVEQLATELEGLDIQDQELSEYVSSVSEAYRQQATAHRANAELVNSEGIVSFRVGDTAKENAHRKMMADAMRANNAIQSSLGAMKGYCVR